MGIATRLPALGANPCVSLTLAVSALLLTGCGHEQNTDPAAVGAPFSDGGVAVSVRVESHDGGLRVLADLRPERDGFHVYSLTLPDGGVDGIGIPTRIRTEGALRSAGPATTDARERVVRPDGLDVRLPVYEDGRVTLQLPVRRVGGTDRAKVLLSYGACSERDGCLAPVRDRAVALTLRPTD
ncbi:hypothetical protein [Streptomyces lannensis]|uniref:Thiol:disulfide interchange protein DsbD N-terminal domain-containing protein n=1 Tax=Streptomyces lannensis TaxID=766498 RepID=A0ABP7KR31_9ACTN